MIWFGLMLACGGSGSSADPHEAPGHAGHDHATVTHRFDDVEKWVEVFDDPERDAWQKPADVVAALDLRAGHTVADLGAGTGYLVPHLASAVGESGRVIAVEVENSLVQHMKGRFSNRPEVQVRLTDGDASGLTRSEVDRVVLLDVYHHISNRTRYFGALRRAMRPGGLLTVVDFDPEASGGHGPPAEHRIPLARVSRELQEAGWVSIPVTESLPEQYVGRFGMARSDADVEWLAAALDHGSLQLVDVRTVREYTAGHVPGARNIPIADLEGAEGLDKSQPVVVVCQSGGRSSQAAAQLADAGYQAINVIGGTSAWAQSGHPLEL